MYALDVIIFITLLVMSAAIGAAIGYLTLSRIKVKEAISDLVENRAEYDRLRLDYLRHESANLIQSSENYQNWADMFDASSDRDRKLAEEYVKEISQLEGNVGE